MVSFRSRNFLQLTFMAMSFQAISFPKIKSSGMCDSFLGEGEVGVSASLQAVQTPPRHFASDRTPPQGGILYVLVNSYKY